MQLVTEDYQNSMHRVHIVHALAECLKMEEVVTLIEEKSGNIESEGELVRIEKLVFSKVLELRAQDNFPPKNK